MPIRLAVFLAAAVTTAAVLAQDPAAPPVAADGHAKSTDRLLADSDLAARKAVEAVLREGLEADRATKQEPAARLASLRALAVAAARELPSGSRAWQRVETALERAAKANPESAKSAADELRLDLADVRSDLAFQPTREAELPKGFPAFASLDEIELRDYPAYRMVRAPMRKNGSMSAFWMLFQHIKKNDIAMTTPVQFDYDEKGEHAVEQSMAFLYGDASIGEAGMQGKVEVVDVPAATVLSLGARGIERPALVESLRERLQSFAAAHAEEFAVAGPMRMMGYNSPSVGDDRRYFEVQLPVTRVEPKGKGAAKIEPTKPRD